MTFIGAGAYGIAGGLAASLVALSAAIVKAGYKWPWRGEPDGIWPRFTVYAIGLIVGGIVCACAHSDMSGGWPAFLMGVAAPSVIQNAIGLVEVSEARKAVPADTKTPVAVGAEGDDGSQA
jgi:hypothetical protein